MLSALFNLFSAVMEAFVYDNLIGRYVARLRSSFKAVFAELTAASLESLEKVGG
jgi:hypothetical protein